jgi:spiro-SPASM protein
MNALAVLFGGSLNEAAYEKAFGGKNALTRAVERAAAFPGVSKIILLAGEDFDPSSAFQTPLPASFEVLKASGWTKQSLLETLASRGAGFDLSYYGWADCPLLDPALAGAVAERHLRYAAEYSYADGWPYGFAPEILSPPTAGILARINHGEAGPVERDTLFHVIQRDINAFDIETEISPADLRNLRLSLQADSRRNLLLLTRLISAGLEDAGGAEKIIRERPELLRTLPRFYALQVAGPCPQSCGFCPYSRLGAKPGLPVTERKDFMEAAAFEGLLERISAFSGDAVIDLSLWGELSLHPQRIALIEMVLSRRNLSLVVETSGVGWKPGDFEALAALAAARKAADARAGGALFQSPGPLSWIVSLDAADPRRYGEIRGPGLSEAAAAARTLLGLFPGDAYVQAVRERGFEDDIEQFYRTWKEAPPQGGAKVIIQKYDYFCGFLPEKRASDLSPVKRQPCWHLMRDMNIQIDGRVPLCREDLSVFDEQKGALGNALEEPLESVWERGEGLYREQCAGLYPGICAGCDEYYTFNF